METSNKEGSQNLLTRHRSFGPLRLFEKAYKTFSSGEKMLFGSLLLLTVIFSIIPLVSLYNTLLTEVPSKGGSYSEGIIGTPRFINPLLETSDADRDLTILVYSGLMRSLPDGGLVPELAKDYTVSEDGLVYDFTLRDNLKFHDGTDLTAFDIEFTIKKAQDPFTKSQKRSGWEGVQVTVIDEQHIQFTLRQAYAPFIENTTLGILPKHIWKDFTAEEFAFSLYNIEPIGSGPYKISSIKTGKDRTPVSYKLTPFKHFALGSPFLSKLTINLYPNEAAMVEAFKTGEVDAIGGIDPHVARDLANNNVDIKTAELPRVFGVFFNQNQNDILLSNSVREALNTAINREELIGKVLEGYGTPLSTPYAYIPNTTEWDESNITEANEILESAGWVMNEVTGIREKKVGGTQTALTFTLSTAAKSDLKATAELLHEQWRKIGADVKVSIYENGDLNQNIIRPRKYEALLFGEIVAHDYDLYPFWHSSERNDPGLNIALYANITADKLLEDLRTNLSAEKRSETLDELINEINTDIPALFLYSPQYIYITKSNLQSITINKITLPAERFLTVNDWFIETNKVWDLFTDSVSS